MLETILQYLHNWFRVQDSNGGRHHDVYTIEGGNIALPFLVDGQYFRILGSLFNDGLYIYGDTITDGDGGDIELKDETFDGSIWALAVPRGVIELSRDIAEWNKKYGDAISSPFTSESFGGYSYSKSTGGTRADSVDVTGWQSAFAAQLSAWRKLRDD